MSGNVTEERMQILKMIEDGKVSASEGMELLNALEKSEQEIVPRSGEAKWLNALHFSMA
jgi:hypothetical protein